MNGNKVRGLMAENRHTQEYVSKELEISPVSLRSKLSGETEFKASELQKLSKMYGVPIDYFFSI